LTPCFVYRLTTLLASLKEMPKIRYKSVGPDGVKGGSVAAAVAEKVHRQTAYLANKSGQSLSTTCDVLIVDRSVDPIAPIVHEWYVYFNHRIRNLTDGVLHSQDVRSHALRLVRS
jgi:syntaxin-binding protein 1